MATLIEETLQAAELLAAAYKLAGRTTFKGLLISIETKKGQIRKGIGADNKPWEITMPWDYGYIRGTKGADGQHVDCFLGPDKDSDKVFVIHQHKEDSEKYDEDKVMLGWDSKEEAVSAYKSAYKIDILMDVDELTFEKFTEKIFDKKGKRITAGGPGSGWFRENGHIKHAIKTSQNVLRRAGWTPDKATNIERDRWIHKALPGHVIRTLDRGNWRHYDAKGKLVAFGNTTVKLKKHLKLLKDPVVQQGLGMQRIQKPAISERGLRETSIAKTAAPVAMIPVSELEEKITSGKVSSKQNLGGGISTSELVTLDNGAKGVWKPNEGTPPIEEQFHADPGKNGQRETAAFEIAKLVGLTDLVPPTVFRKIEGKEGSLQAFIPNAQTGADVFGHDKYDGIKDAARAAAFDYVIGNQDRHAWNWMVQSDRHIKLIDHGFAFPKKTNFTARSAGFLNYVKFPNFLRENEVKRLKTDLRPKVLAEPYVKAQDKIVKVVSNLGLSKSVASGIKDRIADLAKIDTWMLTKYDD